MTETPQSSNDTMQVWVSLHDHHDNGLLEVAHASLQLACEDSASRAWRAVCSGKGMVDTGTRKVFKAAEKAHAHPDFTGTMYDAIAAAVERRAKRDGYCILSVDGLSYGVRIRS